jgi:hypothetical protein
MYVCMCIYIYILCTHTHTAGFPRISASGTTYANVSRRMLTYADVCSMAGIPRISASGTLSKEQFEMHCALVRELRSDLLREGTLDEV